MVNILPLQQNFPLVDKKGSYTVAFKRWLDDVLSRIGGISGGVYAALSYSSSITWDLDHYPTAEITLAGNPTINAVNPIAGPLFMYRLTLIQDATGNRTVTWGSMFKFASSTAPTLSTAAGAVDVLLFDSDGTYLKNLSFQKGLG